VRGLARTLFELLVPSVCPGCDAPRESTDTVLCNTCALRVRRVVRLRAVHVAIAYEGTGLELVRRFKFEHRRDARALLVHWLAERVSGLPFDAVVAVPRHPQRVRSEGSDPAHELAAGVARATGAWLAARALSRARPTAPQAGLSIGARRANVAQSFAAEPGALTGARVLLVDDVATTGATLAEAARTLRRASGAKRITLAAVAATPPPVL